ncbi:hypothetical protein M0802_005212 [Mischocyttarus mexicanus]|nr:hypothetical protein M0802_005212 [Mischocyttarus mexicanus]
MQSSINNDTSLTPIQKFYDDQNIFITGGTGFIGKLLIEKLLRSCPNVNIYILIRPKKGKDVFQRVNELFEDMVFSKLREEQPKFRNRIICIEGDCNLPNLGISTLERTTLIAQISIVFHVAANIKFNENIKSATITNVQGLKNMINLSKEMPKLKSFVYVSTAYCQCLHNPIEEKFYDPPIDDEKLIELLDSIDENSLDEFTKTLCESWPNTYVYTKSIAENVIKKQAGVIPIGIFRPGIVASTYREPLQGWVNNLNGPMGIFAGVWKGLIRTHHCDRYVKVCLVPGDFTINALIVCAWDIADKQRSEENIPIYNYVSNENPITYDDMEKFTLKYGPTTPFREAYWYYNFRSTKNRLLYLFYAYLLHLLPALILDLGMLCVRKKPRFLKMYRKLHAMLDVLSYFSLNEWKFTNERMINVIKKLTVKDQILFYCDMKDLDWDSYFATYLLGIRLYVLKDPIETLPQARRNWRRKVGKQLTPIQKFYDDQNIFITGGTGLIGKLLIEKLLRSCPNVNIYILIRPKKGKDIYQRTNELFEDVLFFKLKEEQPKFRNRIICIEGDCSLPNLGIATLERTTLIEQISIIFHSAANIRFNENIKLATTINVQGLKYMISLSKEMPKLKVKILYPMNIFERLLKTSNAISEFSKYLLSSIFQSFVHVSTAYCQCLHNPIEEKFYDPPIDDEKLIELLDSVDENSLDEFTKKLCKSWPNTYVYTKSVAENVIKKQAGLMPIGIFRPGIVTSTYREPLKGWVDSYNGPVIVYACAGKGFIRSFHCDGSVETCLVPGDLTTNALIVSAWDIANKQR